MLNGQKMMRQVWLLFITCVAVASYSATALAGNGAVTMQYSGLPLEISIPVGKEVKMQFAEPQVVAMDSFYLNNFIVPTSSNSQVLLFGKSETQNVRVIFQGANSRSVVVANITVCDCNDLPVVYLIDNNQLGQNANSGSDEVSNKTHKSPSHLNGTQDENMQVLLRYINQQTGPKDAVEVPTFRITKLSEKLRRQVVGLYRGGRLDTYIHDVYQGGGLTAITIVAKNNSNEYVALDPTNVRGQWLGMQPWKKGLMPNEKGVFILVVEGDVPEGMLAVLAGVSL